MLRVLAALPLAAAVVLAAPAAACSVGADYRLPGNFEQVMRAETIVLAEVVAGQLDTVGQDPFESTITIRPLQALKGPLPAGDIALKGMMLSRDAGPELGMLSDPAEFDRAHPVSYLGGCIRYVFPLGTTALFFLRTDHEGHWAPAAEPFTRWAEDVRGADAPWVGLVRRYVHAAGLPAAERARYLAAERDALRARSGDHVAQLMAADIDRQLAAAPVADARLEAELRRLHRAAIEAGN
jgi:hypothetical protein